MNDLDSIIAHGRDLLLAGNLNDAMALYNGALSQAKTVDQVARIAQIFAETGHPTIALDLWRQLYTASPDTPELAYEYARTLTAVGKPADAAPIFRKMIARSPEMTHAHLGLTLCALQLGDWESAESSAREARRLAPDSPDAAAALAQALSRQGRLNDAIDAQAAAVSLAPDRLNLLCDLALYRRATGDIETAESTLISVLERDPAHGVAAEQLALIRFEQRRSDEAFRLMERAVAALPSDRRLRMRLAQRYYESDAFERALAHLQALNESDPNDFAVYSPMATSLVRLERLEEAVAACNRGLAIQPDDTEVRLTKARALFFQGKFKEAEAVFQRLPGSLLPPGYFEAISLMLRESLKLDGDVIECGVYKGGATVEIAKLLRETGKVVHACDTFAGIPDPSRHDNYHVGGDFGDTSLKAVETRWEFAGVRDLIVPHKGLFEATFPTMLENRYCLAFLDADHYVSMLQALDHVYARTLPGGWIVIDDYGWIHTAGCKVAVDEFLQDKPEKAGFGCILGCLFAFRKL